MSRWALIAGLLLGIAGCGIFGGDDEEIVDPPAELVAFDASIKVSRIWSARVGDGTEFLRLGLTPASDGSHIYAASHDGTIVALDLETGRRLWAVDTKLRLSAGPGIGDGLVVAGSNDGDLVTLAAHDGSEQWRVTVTSEVLAPPAIARGIVVVRTVDGRLRGLAAGDGSEVWVVEHKVPRLSLRGNSAPVIAGTPPLVLCGFDNGKVSAVGLVDGEVAWESIVTPPRGRTELERLADVDATVRVVGNDAYVVGFQGRVGMLALESGALLWADDMSSYGGIGVDWNNLYVTTSHSEIVALQRDNGGLLWRTDLLRRRGLTAPTPYGNAVVVGDFEGYLHWLDPESGQMLARVRADDATISSPPIVVGESLFVLTDGGRLTAYKVADSG